MLRTQLRFTPFKMASLLPWLNVKYIFLLLAVAVSLCSTLGSTPLLIWSNQREMTQVESIALGHQSSVAEVKNLLKHYFDPTKMIVIFLQDKLSLDDFTKYRRRSHGKKSAVFSNIQKLIGSNANSIVPSMVQDDNEKPFVSFLKELFGNNVEEIYSSDIESWHYDEGKEDQSKLYIFHLPPVKRSTEIGKLSILSRNDDIVGEIASQFPKNLKYVGILTASEPSEIVEKMESKSFINEESEVRRHLLGSSASSSEGKLFNFKGCVFLFAKSISFTLGQDLFNVLNASYTLSGHCTNNMTSVSIAFGKGLPVNFTQFELRMNFEKLENTDWTCTNVDVTYSGNFNETIVNGVNVLFPSCREKIVTPRDMSYSCGDFSLKNGTTKLSFGHFQVQPFGLKNNRFSNAFDCIGFFTTPILTGLFVTSILISIAFGGIIAMMGISTMDRFDDPKGPTIQVPHE